MQRSQEQVMQGELSGWVGPVDRQERKEQEGEEVGGDGHFQEVCDVCRGFGGLIGPVHVAVGSQAVQLVRRSQGIQRSLEAAAEHADLACAAVPPLPCFASNAAPAPRQCPPSPPSERHLFCVSRPQHHVAASPWPLTCRNGRASHIPSSILHDHLCILVVSPTTQPSPPGCLLLTEPSPTSSPSLPAPLAPALPS